ncbi:MAG: phosphodiester glycosidase family protein [Lachnospiraceae bacterium]
MCLKRYIWPIIYSIILSAFTAYVLLDTFVIPRTYSIVQSEESIDSSGSYNSREDGNSIQISEEISGINHVVETTKEVPYRMASDASYSDENITISITEYREYDTNIYVAEIWLSSPGYLKTAFAGNTYGKNVTAKTSETARSNNAILAINGDYYGARENGYVLRNGVIYRDTAARNQEALVIDKNGSLSIAAEEEISIDQLLAEGAQQILSFGPPLLDDSGILVTEAEEVGKAKASNPRTAIGSISALHYVFAVSDGRTAQSAGLSLYELAEFMQSLGVTTAYNLDGGGSSTMYFNGEVINNPTTNGKSIKERSVSDIVYIGY